jgi:LysM repeat protein
MARPARAPLARYLAPAAFLLGVTVAVLLIHSALGGKGTPPATTLRPVTQASTARTPPNAKTTLTFTQTGAASTVTGTSVAGAEYATVQKGDTFFSIATRSGTTVGALDALNPGVSSNSLQVGQQIRVK